MATRSSTKRRKERGASGPGAHAFWSGTISFGLVSIPVSLFPTNHATNSSLKMLAPDGSPLRRQYYCPVEDRDVHPEHIQRGYELENGKYVVVRDEELEGVEPRKSHIIDLRQFVDRSAISPAYFERAYVLTPGGESTKAYHLLATAMEETNRAGIATFVMRDREYLVAILSENGVLRAQTMRFHDELRTPEDVGLSDPPEVDKASVSKFKRLIHTHTATKLTDTELHDKYGEHLQELAQRKRKRGVDLVEIRQEEPTKESDSEESGEVDLLDAIRRSLQGQNGTNKPRMSHTARSRPRHRQRIEPAA